MGIDNGEMSKILVKERVQQIFARDGGKDSPLNQFSAAEVLSSSLLQWKEREVITQYYLNAAVANVTPTAKEAFFKWLAAQGQDDVLFRDVFYLKAAINGIGINEPRDQIKHLVSFSADGSSFQFKAGVCAEQRYKLIQGLRAHDESTDDIYLIHLQGLKADLEKGPLQNDPQKTKILDKINRENLLHDQTCRKASDVKIFYSQNPVHQKLDDLKKTVLGERVVIDYWVRLFDINPLLTIPGLLLFVPYLIGAALAGWNPSTFITRTDDAIKTEFDRIRAQRSEKKRERGSHRYRLLPPPPAENQVADQAGEGFAYRMAAG